jgi:hypothetical protein
LCRFRVGLRVGRSKAASNAALHVSATCLVQVPLYLNKVSPRNLVYMICV